MDISPSNEAIGVAVDSNIVATFSEAIQRGSGAITLRDADGAVVESFDAANSPRLIFDGATLTIDPSAELSNSAGYSVEFSTGSVEDLSGVSYAGSVDYHFFTIGEGGSLIEGTPDSDSLTGGVVDDTLDGGDGRGNAGPERPAPCGCVGPGHWPRGGQGHCQHQLRLEQLC
ncbi:MAG: Ig-like domain-containing protein [Rhodoferax sp.]|nr:Ig-like domain-containing protein [Rhodoferax sp.]